MSAFPLFPSACPSIFLHISRLHPSISCTASISLTSVRSVHLAICRFLCAIQFVQSSICWKEAPLFSFFFCFWRFCGATVVNCVFTVAPISCHQAWKKAYRGDLTAYTSVWKAVFGERAWNNYGVGEVLGNPACFRAQIIWLAACFDISGT